MAKKETNEDQEENDTQQDVANSSEDEALQTDDSSSESEGYEFSDEENMVFEELSMRVVFVARIMVIASVLGVVRSIFVIRTDILSGILSFLIVGIMCAVGFLHFGAAKSFKKIVSTEGDDINFVMMAMKDLKKYYKVFGVLAWVAMIAIFSYTVVNILETLL